jgi:DNA-binding beta-propeller fold protein YncE
MTSGSARNSMEYVVDRDWPAKPGDITLNDVAGVAVDDSDRVYVFSRSAHPVTMFATDGKYLGSWGAGIFGRPHGIDIGPDGSVYLTDDGDHTVRKFTPDGQLLMQLGIAGHPSEYMSGKPFNRCTHTALSPAGDIYVSDGYHNHSMHKFTASGEWRCSWGGSGVGPGEFNLPHNIGCDTEGRVYVADRENHRVQVFDEDGTYIREWWNVHRPSALAISRGAAPVCLIGEAGPTYNFNRNAPNLGPRVSIFDLRGSLLVRIGASQSASGSSSMLAPHGIAMDTRGSIYVAEPAMTRWRASGAIGRAPADVTAVRKLTAAN